MQLIHCPLSPARSLPRRCLAWLLVCVAMPAGWAMAQSHAPAAHDTKAGAARMPASAASAAMAAASSASSPATPQDVAERLRAELQSGAASKRVTLVVGGKEKKYITIPMTPPKEAAAAAAGHAAMPPIPAVPGRLANPHEVRMALATGARKPAAHGAAAASHGGEVHWSYGGEAGPQAWGSLKPEFNLCAAGQRQSPINIDETMTLRGPAEPLQFDYQPSSASVVNNGHTIQVDVSGDNSVTVRGSNYRLLQFHFHTPSEERINHQAFALVAHLVHRNTEGQLAVVAVLFEAGATNPTINKVWTYMPLDANDRVRMPSGLLNLAELLPKDQRYYQFMGSLTTPPCSEGVLWMVLKQPVTLSREQLRLFSQIFPNNARPVQPLNGRAVRDAQ